MKKIFLLFLVMQQLIVSGQRSDGFFVNEYTFVDPNLLTALKVDKLEIVIYENNRRSGAMEIFLDSNQRLVKQVIDYADSIRTEYFGSTTISQFACPVQKPAYIKNCENGRITKTESEGAYRVTDFDSEGRVISDRFKPGKNLLEIKRRFVYSADNLMDSILLEDIANDGHIDKKELHLYNYTGEQLMSITQFIESSEGYQKAGEFKFKNFNCGLVKRMDANAYFGRYKARTEFRYYSKGQQLR